MKRILPLCLTCLMSLAACSVQGAAIPAAAPESVGSAVAAPPAVSQELSAPPASPFSISLESQVLEGTEWKGELSSLPQELADGQAELSYLLTKPSGAALLARLPEKDISLYGIWDEEHPEGQCLLRVGERAWVYDLLWATPRCYLPQLHCGDFDSDGSEELALLTYVGSGTGVSYWTLTLVELEGETPTLRAIYASSFEDALAPHFSCSYNGKTKQATLAFSGTEPEVLDFSRFTPSLPTDASLFAAVGDVVDYAVEENTITVCLGVNLYGDDIPRTCLYPADIEAQVVYSGNGFSLCGPVMIPVSNF